MSSSEPHFSASNAPSRPMLATGNYDRVAWCYDVLATLVFGPALRRAQRAALEAGLPPGAPRILVLGGGTGGVLLEILRRRPAAHILYLEASGRMLNRSRQRLLRYAPTHATQVEFRHGTEQSLRAGEKFDALVTFFVLDCFPAALLPAALLRLNAARQLHAPWLLADFRATTSWWQQRLLRAMYAFFQLSAGLQANSLPNLPAAFANLGLQPQSIGTFFGGMIEAVVFRFQEPPKIASDSALRPIES